MKASNLRKGLRVKVKECCGIEMHRGKCGTVVNGILSEFGTVLIKIDAFDGAYCGNVKLKLTSIKLSDEKPEVGDRIVTLSKPTRWFDIGATGIVRCVGDKDLLVKFDGGVYLPYNSWYVGYNRKIGIIEGDVK